MDPKTKQEICKEWIARVFGAEFANRDVGESDVDLQPWSPSRAGPLPAPGDPFYQSVRTEWGQIVEILFSSAPVDGTLTLPEEFIRLRAVQEISAAEAVSHIFVLKDIVRERILPEKGYEDLSRRLDFLALHTFNSFMQCRERLFQLRLKEMKEYGAAETFSCSSSQFNK